MFAALHLPPSPLRSDPCYYILFPAQSTELLHSCDLSNRSFDKLVENLPYIHLWPICAFSGNLFTFLYLHTWSLVQKSLAGFLFNKGSAITV
jgi:hypothetical protein